MPRQYPRRLVLIEHDPDDPRHGTYGGYVNHKCRCEACTVANRVQQRLYRQRNPQRSYHRRAVVDGTAAGWLVRSTIDQRWNRSGDGPFDPELVDILTTLYGPPPDDLEILPS